LNTFLGPIRESAGGCANRAIIVEALDLVEGGKPDIDDDFVMMTRSLGGVLDMGYLVNGEMRDLEIFATPEGLGPGNSIGPESIIAMEMNPTIAGTRIRSLLDKNVGTRIPAVSPMDLELLPCPGVSCTSGPTTAFPDSSKDLTGAPQNLR